MKVYITSDKQVTFVIDGIKESELLSDICNSDPCISSLLDAKITNYTKKKIMQRIRGLLRVYIAYSITEDGDIEFVGYAEKKKKK